MALKIGTHLSQLSYYDPATCSPDILARQASGLDTSRMSDTLASAHAVGDNLLTIATPSVWSDDPGYTGVPSTGLLTVRDLGTTNGGVSRGSVRYAYTTVKGSTKLILTGVALYGTTDVICDAGSLVSRNGASVWVNDGPSPLAANHVVSGRDTGYPAGLAANQSMRVVYKSSRATPAGTWTMTAKGTGTLAVTAGAYTKTFAFVDGACSSPTLAMPTIAVDQNWLITLTASNAAAPLYDARFIMPGSDPDSGKTFVQLYAENASNPTYFLHHPDYLAYYLPFACIRTADNNVNSQSSPPMKAEWVDRSKNTQLFGYNSGRSMPVEQEVQLCNEIGRDLWHNTTHRETDASIAALAAYFLDTLDPRLKVWVEHNLEVWNWNYWVKYWAIARWSRETDGLASLTRSGTTATATWGVSCLRRYVSGITRSGSVATVTCPLHGLSVGSLVNIGGANQADYNGTFTVTGIPTANTFTLNVANSPATPATGAMFATGHGLIVGDSIMLTGATDQGWNGTFTVAGVTDLLAVTFTVSGSPASPAVAIEDHHILAYKNDAKVMPIDVGSLQFTMGTGTYAGSFSAAGTGLVESDYFVLSGCADVRANGIWRAGKVTSGTTLAIYACPASTRDLPTDMVGSVPIAAAPGKTIRFRKIVSNASVSGYPQSDDSAARWMGRRYQQIFAIMRPIMGSRLVPVIGGWYVDSAYNAAILAQYKADNGGVFTGDEVFAVAPYFKSNAGGGADIDENCVSGYARVVNSLTSAGGIATATTSGAHGFVANDTVRIIGVNQVEYNGGFTVLSAPTTTTFTYAVPGSPAATATGTTDGMKVSLGVRALGFNVTSITRSGNIATATAIGHNVSFGVAMRIAGADQAEYNGDHIVLSTTSTTITFEVAGTPATPATTSGTIRGGYSGAFGGRELISLTSAGGVATATCPGHGLTTGQVWFVAGVDDTVSGGAVTGSCRGARSITVVDANTFTFPVTGAPAATATTSPGNGGARIWMFSDRTMSAGFAALNAMVIGPGSGAFPQLMAAFVAKYITPNGLRIAAYESGQHLASVAGPAAAAFYFELNRDPRMGDCYLSYYQMLDAAGFILANHYKSFGSTGAGNQFGALEYQGQAPGAKQSALTTLLTTTYYNAPLEGGGITPREGIMRIQASLNLGNGMAGILANLRAQPQSADGSGTDTDIGSPISTGFTDKGNGFYRWDYTGLDATLVGGVRFYNSDSPSVTLGYGLVDPRQAVTTAAYVDPAAALTNVGLTPTRALKLDNLDVASSTLATPSSVSTSVGAGLTAAGFTSARALKLDNLDVAVGARFNSLDTSVASATAASTAVNGKFDATRLSKLDNLLASGTYSTFAGGAVASVTAPVAVAGSVNIGGYATGQDPASLILATPSNKLATDGNGRVSAGTVLDKVGYSVAGGVTVSGYATGQDPATLVLSTPQNRLKTDTTGRVILAAVSHDGAIVPTVGEVTNKSGFALAAAGLDTVTIEPGINIRQAISPILAASAGTLSGAGTGTVVIKGGNNAPTRITASTDNAGNRSSVTLNLPA
ncbi:hypothetical protein EP7_005235 [Isosphaeraceae bacterium EP7]